MKQDNWCELNWKDTSFDLPVIKVQKGKKSNPRLKVVDNDSTIGATNNESLLYIRYDLQCLKFGKVFFENIISKHRHDKTESWT